MDALTDMFNLDIKTVILGVFIIIVGLDYAFRLLTRLGDMFGIEFKWLRKRNEDHDRLLSNSDKLNEICEQRNKDMERSIKHGEKIEEDLSKVSDSLEDMKGKLETIDDRTIRTENASRESLGDVIAQKYIRYIQLNGIPSDELDEFCSLHDAYKAVGGNHAGDAKFNYCINNLQILPPSAVLDVQGQNSTNGSDTTNTSNE